MDRLENKFDEFSQNPLDSKLGCKNVISARTNDSLIDSQQLDVFSKKLEQLEAKILPKITLHSSMASDWQVTLEHPSEKVYKQMLRKYVINWPNQREIITYEHHQQIDTLNPDAIRVFGFNSKALQNYTNLRAA